MVTIFVLYSNITYSLYYQLVLQLLLHAVQQINTIKANNNKHFFSFLNLFLFGLLVVGGWWLVVLVGVGGAWWFLYCCCYCSNNCHNITIYYYWYNYYIYFIHFFKASFLDPCFYVSIFYYMCFIVFY